MSLLFVLTCTCMVFSCTQDQLVKEDVFSIDKNNNLVELDSEFTFMSSTEEIQLVDICFTGHKEVGDVIKYIWEPGTITNKECGSAVFSNLTNSEGVELLSNPDNSGDIQFEITGFPDWFLEIEVCCSNDESICTTGTIKGNSISLTPLKPPLK